MGDFKNRSQWLFFGLVIVIFIGGFFLWQTDLESDPPTYFSGIGQSLITDPAQYTFHARNKVLFDEFDPYEYPRWTVYQHSITSLTAYIWFSIAGSSLEESNMVGVFLSIGALILILLGIGRHHRFWVIPVVTFIFLINVVLFTHGRVSYLENGLLFYSALLFFIYSYWGNKIWGALLAGLIIAAAALTGKLFGFLLLPVLILTIYFSKSTNRWKLIGAGFGSFVVSSLILIFLLYGSDLGAAIGYLGEQAYGLRGFPEGLRSPWGFIEHLISYGFTNHLFYLNPDLMLFLAVGCELFVFYSISDKKVSPATMFSLFWIVIFILGLMPLNYSPVRYAVVIIPAIMIFCFSIFDSSYGEGKRSESNIKKWYLYILILITWYALFHLIANVFYLNAMPRPIRMITWGTLPAGIGIAWLMWNYIIIKKLKKINPNILWITALVLVITASTVSNASRLYRFHYLDNNYNILEANQDIAEILSEGAVISGSYGPVLTIDDNKKSFIHHFQVANVDSSLFENNRITHLAIDISNYNEAIKNYPLLQNMPAVAKYWICDNEVVLYRISELSPNPEARTYCLSDFEQAARYKALNVIDSALFIAIPFYQNNPESKSAGLLLADLYVQTSHTNKAYSILLNLAERFPTDFYVQLHSALLLQTMAYYQQNDSYFDMSMKFYERAVKVNPFKADYCKQIWLELDKKLRSDQNKK